MKTRQDTLKAKYLPRYLTCKSRQEKSYILDEIVEVLGYNRKYAINNLKTLQLKSRYAIAKRRGRKRIYNNVFNEVLIKIWTYSDKMCAELLHVYIANTLDILIEQEDITCSPDIYEKLRNVSVGTIKTRIKEHKKRNNIGRGKSTTKGSSLQSSIPIRTHNWDIKGPGWHETDYVAHCGQSAEGAYLNSLHVTDIHTGWTSLRAFVHANQKNTFNGFQSIEDAIPYALRGLNPDNGSEFINHMLWSYYSTRLGVEYTRSRPYKKNDNAVVERKNSTIIRKYTGYLRYEEDSLPCLRELYKNVQLFVNFFQPTQKVIRITLENGKVKKKRDTAKTPYQRLLESDALKDNRRIQLQRTYEKLNPVYLQQSIQKLKKELMQSGQY